ncbi:MAG: gephyrin-like molybdotransferase Glp [Terriglobales bacterium]
MSSPPSISPSARLVSFEAARHLVERHASRVAPVALEVVDLLAASGRVLAEPIAADRDFPPFARATRDGYAVRSADLARVPTQLEIVGELKAGDWPERVACSVGPGQAVEIMTGAPLPTGADAVVMVEHTSVAQQSDSRRFVSIQRTVSEGENFVPCGAEARAGQLLLDRGRRLDYAAIAIAASVGKSRLQVFRKPRVAILSTGDELVGIDATPKPAQIRNSNSYSLAAQVLNAGGEPVLLAIAPDEFQPLRALIEKGLACDLLLLTGGVSMGKYDLVEQVLEQLHADFYFTGAHIQPGRPVVFGSCGAAVPIRVSATNSPLAESDSSDRPRRFFFGLPGNPVSTMVTFELFVTPMLQRLSGMTPLPLIFLRARLTSDIQTKTGLKRFLPAVLSGEFETAAVELARWQGSGDIAALARANCYVVIPPDRERITAGEWVSLLMR